MAMHAGFTESVTRLPMSWDEYNQLGDNVHGEYIDGALLMAPAPDRHHQTVVTYLVGQLSRVCIGEEGVVAGWGWTPKTATEEYIPDVLVHPATEDQIRFHGIPLLCVEITSSNRTDDLILKRAKYAAAGLHDYWVVDRREKALLQYELRGDLLEEAARTAGHGSATVRFAGREVDIDLDLVLYAR